MKSTVFTLVCVALLFGCDSNFHSDDEVNIRIENVSEFDMDSVTVAYPEEERFYGNIVSGKNSGYKAVTKAYRYAYIETKIDGELSVLQPIDYFGESLLDPGFYTYILTVHEVSENQDSDAPNYNLSLELRED